MENKKGCLISLGIYILFIMALGLAFRIFDDWSDRHPVKFCDEIKEVKDSSPIVCKLRYPMLNSEEIQNIKKENEDLKVKNFILQSKIENIDKSIKDDIEDNWQPDLPQIDY